MSQSAPKRQRVSVDRYVSRDTDKEAVTAHSTPTTPNRRASYLSPTKASLARSHPNLLLKDLRKASTEPRGGDPNVKLPLVHTSTTITNLRPQQYAASTSVRQSKRTPRTHIHQNGSVNSERDLAAEITQAFKDIPTQSEPAHNPVQQFHKSPQEFDVGARKPLSSGQPRATRSRLPRAQSLGSDNADDQPETSVPKLVKRSEVSSQLHASSEIDLPPTPVQLGLSVVPHRPRGLASSSSAGSRSGSGRHRTRVRGGRNGSTTSSPLKTRLHAKMQRSPGDSAQVSEKLPENVFSSDIDESSNIPNVTLSDEAKQKQLVLSRLIDELETLRKDIENLEMLTEMLEDEKELEINPDITTILTKSGQISRSDLLEIDRTFVTDNEAYLKLFAPADLQLNSATKTIIVSQHSKIVHTLTVSAPQPWPSLALQLSFNIVIDIDKVCIDSIAYNQPRHSNNHKALQNWIDARLGESLHRHDIGSLIFGSGQYFDACIQRAKVFQQLSIKYINGLSVPLSKERTPRITHREAVALVNYMTMTQITLSCAASTTLPAGEASARLRKQILLTYELDLTWTGTVNRKVHITCTGVGNKTQKSAQDLFQKLIKTNAITDAVGSVWKMLKFKSKIDESTITSSKGHFPARRNQSKLKAGQLQ